MGPDELNGPLKGQLTMESPLISKMGALHFDKLCIMAMTNHKFIFGANIQNLYYRMICSDAADSADSAECEAHKLGITTNFIELQCGS